METKLSVLYEALKQSIDPLIPALTDAFDQIYNIPKEEKGLTGTEKLSDLLEWASDVAYEYEVKQCIKGCERH